METQPVIENVTDIQPITIIDNQPIVDNQLVSVIDNQPVTVTDISPSSKIAPLQLMHHHHQNWIHHN
jgi:hypothetical protein